MQYEYILHHGEMINDITYEVSIRKEAALFARQLISSFAQLRRITYSQS